ncbi:hypothetical protein BC829DRAFT_176847 [Chytridium lagenaria]|nr:hypothetical protein BC829DRAFT_176847 [Chytridium lagenaria]
MQMIRTALVFLAVISAAFAQTFSIIQPFTNTQFAPGASVLVTWTASGFPAGATLTLRLQDIRNGPNTGQPYSTFSGTVPISANSVTVTLPSNLPSGTWVSSSCTVYYQIINHALTFAINRQSPPLSTALTTRPLPSPSVAPPSLPQYPVVPFPPLLLPPLQPPPQSPPPHPLQHPLLKRLPKRPSHSRQHHRPFVHHRPNHLHPRHHLCRSC